MKKVTSITVIVWMALANTTWAGQPPASITMVPPQINYQGRLVTVNNTPYTNALHMLDLALYPEASNTKLWQERYFVQTRDGYFSVNMGTGTPQGSYPPLWNVLWKTNASDTDKFYMGITVWTDPLTARTNATAVEATPRQQFLSAPFAMRSFQSVYASKADGIFQASQGVSTPTLISPTNNEIAVNAHLHVDNTIRTSLLEKRDGFSVLEVNAKDGELYLGYHKLAYGGWYPITTYLGCPPDIYTPGGDVQIGGKSVSIHTSDFTVSPKIFEHSSRSANIPIGASSVNVPHGIDATKYEVYIVGYYTSATVPAVRWMKVYSGQTYAQVHFTGNTTASSTISIDFLGIRSGLVLER
jgi:hypothetical protein